MTSERPSISILTPSRNYRRYIEDAVLSVAEQLYPCLEHVVQDGASTDGTDQILARLAARNPQLSYRIAPDQGQSDALNQAVGRARSDWIGWLNADDFYLPGAVAAAADIIASEPEIDVLYGDCVFVDASGQFLRLLPAHQFSRFTLRHYGCFIPSCATFFRRSVLPTPHWDPRMRRIMDWNLWLSFMARGARFRYLPRPLAAFRVHDAQVTHQPVSVHAAEGELIRAMHGLPRSAGGRRASRWFGGTAHAAQKLRDRGYARQLLASRVTGQGDLRWWLTTGARHRAGRLVQL
ncbi:glycosyltransferase family 2 protein [Streptomyces sp. NPDC002896]|uniref:glycosyltransferase family 2 protein n=1 Tax=Streptomyces sp. NPDC002896 TaxID=3154438 RepID=UPI00331C5A77